MTLKSIHIELPDKLYYSIGEVAEAFSVNTSLIRFWEKEFEQIQPKKNAKGNRFFTPSDIKILKQIYHMVKEKGYTLEGAKQALKTQPKIEDKNFEIIQRLTYVRTELLKIKNQLDKEEE